MPFINVHIGKKLTDAQKEELAAMIASHMPILPGKTRDNTLIEISSGRDMFMGGEKRELIFVDMRVMKASPYEAKDEFVATLSAEFAARLGIPVERQYYNIIEMQEWGARGHLNRGRMAGREPRGRMKWLSRAATASGKPGFPGAYRAPAHSCNHGLPAQRSGALGFATIIGLQRNRRSPIHLPA